MDALKDWWDRKKRDPPTYPCMIFGQEIKNEEELAEALSKMTLLTYRENFTAFPRSSCTTDKGWGCLIRTSQMMLARAMSLHGEFHMSHFFDIDDPAYPFSIHNMVRAISDGKSKFKAAYWSPSQGSRAMREVVNSATALGKDSPIAKPIGVHVSDGATIYNDEVLFALRERGSLIILVPVRCGAQRRLSQLSFMTVERIMKHRTSIGVVGGVPNRSYYIIGSSGQRFIYLDPHVQTQAAMLNEDTQRVTYETPGTVPLVNWDRVDTSLLFGFYVKDLEAYNSLSKELCKINEDGTGDKLIYMAERDSSKACGEKEACRVVDSCAGWSSGDDDE